MNEKSVSGGYEGEERPDREHSDWARWDLRRISSGLHAGVVAQVCCNGVVRGLVELKDEEEFKWLKKKIDGDQPVEL